MAHSDERKLALRFCATTVGLLACVFGWVCVLSFDIADPPAHSVWPPSEQPQNLCGSVGAWLAYHLFYYLGGGAYALLGVLSVGVIAWTRAVRLRDPWLRLVGLVLICAAVSTWAAMFPASDKYLMSGPGGVLGAASADFFERYFQTAGTHIVLICAMIVGLLLAADDLVVRVFRWLRWTSRRSVPVLFRGGGAVASAGVAVASGMATSVARVSSRLGNNGQRRDPQAQAEEARRELVPATAPAHSLPSMPTRPSRSPAGSCPRTTAVHLLHSGPNRSRPSLMGRPSGRSGPGRRRRRR